MFAPPAVAEAMAGKASPPFPAVAMAMRTWRVLLNTYCGRVLGWYLQVREGYLTTGFGIPSPPAAFATFFGRELGRKVLWWISVILSIIIFRGFIWSNKSWCVFYDIVMHSLVLQGFA